MRELGFTLLQLLLWRTTEDPGEGIITKLKQKEPTHCNVVWHVDRLGRSLPGQGITYYKGRPILLHIRCTDASAIR